MIRVPDDSSFLGRLTSSICYVENSYTHQNALQDVTNKNIFAPFQNFTLNLQAEERCKRQPQLSHTDDLHLVPSSIKI